jgi:fructose-1,6-bisphosphatase/inositol monophosphatase family enzyme
MSPTELTAVLRSACDTATTILREVASRDLATRDAEGVRSGQYAFDLDVDGPVVDQLLAAGLGVLSEEAGSLHLDRRLVAVVDPVDGSTNASLGLPWFATSICVVDEHGPLQSIVVDQASGTQFEAVRGGGATRNGVAMAPPLIRSFDRAVIGVNGRPPSAPGWGQFRCFGAAALDLCAVASGVLGGYADFDDEAHGVWDYLGAALVCSEVGVEVVDAFGRSLLTMEHTDRRTPVAGCSAEVAERLVALRTDAA